MLCFHGYKSIPSPTITSTFLSLKMILTEYLPTIYVVNLHLFFSTGTKAHRRGSYSARYNITSGAPPARDLCPNTKETYSSRQSTPISPATAALGNTKPMTPSDFDLCVDSPVSLNRMNGPTLTSILRRDSEFIPVDQKMAGVE